MNTRHPFLIELVRILNDEKLPANEKLKKVTGILEFIQKIKDQRQALRTLELQEIELFKEFQKSNPEAKLVVPHIKTTDEDLNLNFCDELSGCTPLTAAIFTNNKDIVSALLKAGANLNFPQQDEKTPLIISAVTARHEILALLLDAKADPNQPNKLTGNTPLLNSASVACMKLLLTANADIHYENKKEGSTALYFSASQQLENEENTRILMFLLEAKADPNYVTTTGMTALNLAARLGRLNFVNILLQAKADPNIASKNSKASSPLVTASNAGHLNCVAALLNARAEPNDIENEGPGYTALHVAALHGHLPIISALIDAKADPNKLSKIGTLPLNYPITTKHEAAVMSLLEKKADINRKNEFGETALFWALYSPDMIIKLIEHKADVDIINYKGKSPLDDSIDRDRLSAINILLNQHASINYPQELLKYLNTVDLRQPDMLPILEELVRRQEAIKSQDVPIANSSVAPKQLFDDLRFSILKSWKEKLTQLNEIYRDIIAIEVKENINSNIPSKNEGALKFFPQGVSHLVGSYTVNLTDYIKEPFTFYTQKIDEQIKIAESIKARLQLKYDKLDRPKF